MERMHLDRSAHCGAGLLRELAGRDEEAVAGTGTEEAVALLDRLLVDGPDVAIHPGDAASLAVSDRDRLLAAVCRRAFGDRIETELVCAGCEEQFTIDFSLAGVEEMVRGGERPAGENGWFRSADGRRFRLPTAVDELAIAALPEAEREQALLRRIVDGGAHEEDTALRTAMEEVGPVVDLDLEAACPGCGRGHEVRFDVQSWLLGMIEAEAPLRALEIHRLATSYGWTLSEILGLTRRRRRAFAALVEKEHTA
jgi:hypothetical protein